MIDALIALDLNTWQWALAALCGILIGAAKAGLAGVAFLAFPLLANIFGARVSTGVALPMLLVGDVFAVIYYHRHASWRHLIRLAPWVMVGLIVALMVGRHVSNRSFGMLFAVTVLVGIAIMLWKERQAKTVNVPKHTWYPRIMGLSAGFATMIGNAAGPLMSLYLLSMRLPKDVFIGTAAWFYLMVNLVKVPLHIYVWHTINCETLAFNLVTAPFIGLGVLGGIVMVKHIPEGVYRILVTTTVILAAAILVFKFLF